jgi:hypothetical protein
MSDDQLTEIVSKRQKLNELRRAKERVKQLERELRGEPRKLAGPVYIPEFLRRQVGSGEASLTNSNLSTNQPLPGSGTAPPRASSDRARRASS